MTIRISKNDAVNYNVEFWAIGGSGSGRWLTIEVDCEQQTINIPATSSILAGGARIVTDAIDIAYKLATGALTVDD